MKWVERMREKPVEERRRKALVISLLATTIVAFAFLVGQNALKQSIVRNDIESEPVRDIASLLAPIEDTVSSAVEKLRGWVEKLREN